MSVTKKAWVGAVGGAGGTVVLSLLRNVLKAVGVVYKTAPMQVVDRLQQAELVADRPVAKRAVALVAHLAYGTGAGAAFGALRRKQEDLRTELAVGAALGVLLWGLVGPGGCRFWEQIVRPGATARPKSCRRCWIMRCTELCGDSCSGYSCGEAHDRF
jgi:hypothetical protein